MGEVLMYGNRRKLLGFVMPLELGVYFLDRRQLWVYCLTLVCILSGCPCFAYIVSLRIGGSVGFFLYLFLSAFLLLVVWYRRYLILAMFYLWFLTLQYYLAFCFPCVTSVENSSEYLLIWVLLSIAGSVADMTFGLIGKNVCPRWGHRRRSMPLFQPFKFRPVFRI